MIFVGDDFIFLVCGMQDGCSLWIESLSNDKRYEHYECSKVEQVVDSSADSLWKNLSIIMPVKEEKPFYKKADAKDAIYWNDEWNNWLNN